MRRIKIEGKVFGLSFEFKGSQNTYSKQNDIFGIRKIFVINKIFGFAKYLK